jgi:multisite-specific tRNA:(cytosine-C5)-methyltransferase
VDVSDMLPSLVRRPGLSTWTPVTDRKSSFFESYDAYIASLPENKRADVKLGRSHWPPEESELEKLHLERW